MFRDDFGTILGGPTSYSAAQARCFLRFPQKTTFSLSGSFWDDFETILVAPGRIWALLGAPCGSPGRPWGLPGRHGSPQGTSGAHFGALGGQDREPRSKRKSCHRPAPAHQALLIDLKLCLLCLLFTDAASTRLDPQGVGG